MFATSQTGKSDAIVALTRRARSHGSEFGSRQQQWPAAVAMASSRVQLSCSSDRGVAGARAPLAVLSCARRMRRRRCGGTEAAAHRACLSCRSGARRRLHLHLSSCTSAHSSCISMTATLHGVRTARSLAPCQDVMVHGVQSAVCREMCDDGLCNHARARQTARCGERSPL